MKSGHGVPSFPGKMDWELFIHRSECKIQCAWYVISKLQCSKSLIFGATMRLIIKTSMTTWKFKERERERKINKLVAGLKKQLSAFTCSRDIADGAVRASYTIANELVQASKPFSHPHNSVKKYRPQMENKSFGHLTAFCIRRHHVAKHSKWTMLWVWLWKLSISSE